MISEQINVDYFKAGGTLHYNAASYVRRSADDDLYQKVMAGHYCYVLTPRQMGKSSLMVRTANRLKKQGIKIAIIDISGMGTVSSQEWYQGIIHCLATELQLEIDTKKWWDEQGGIGPVQRFSDFLRDVILHESTERYVVFFDEIDWTLRLPYTDDFFAAIRVAYNQRANDPEYDRLTFVLLGVAAPGDLIKDRSRTPFNIGHSITLREFNRSEAETLENGLEQVFPGNGADILDRVFFWTNGHPYLTQKLCTEIVDSSGSDENHAQRIDGIVQALFLSENTQQEDNLQFVHHSIEASPDRRQLLQLYRRIYQGQVVEEDRRSIYQNRLKLIGLVHAVEGKLTVRNRIYREVFDVSWIKENTPVQWTKIITVSAIVISIAALLIIYILLQSGRQDRIASYKQDFENSDDAFVRMYFLARLCDLDTTETQAFFGTLESKDQQVLFDTYSADSTDLSVVVDCLYPGTEEMFTESNHDDLVESMCCALYRMDQEQGDTFSQQIDRGCHCALDKGVNHES